MGTVFGVLTQSIVTVVLLRILVPSDYAQYAIALMVGAFSTQAAVAVLERAAMLLPDEEGLKGAGLAVGLMVLGTAGIALAVLATLSGLELVELPLGVVAILLAGNVLAGFAVIPRVFLRRRVRYGPIVSAEIAAQVVGTGLVTLWLAAAGVGAYSIVIGALAGAIITLLALIVAAGHSAYWPVRTAGLRPLVSGALRVLETSLVETTILQIPVIAISFLGANVLGLYNRAMNLVQLPVQMVTLAVSRVFVSELVRAASDEARFRDHARRLVVLTTATLFPVCAGIAGAAHEFTAVIMGQNWLDAAPALPYLAITAATMLVATILGIAADAKGQLRAKSRLLAVSAAILLASGLIALPFGLVSVAMALSLANLAQVALLVMFVGRQSQTPALHILRWFVPGLASGSLCFAWSFLASVLLNELDPVVFGIQIFGCALLTAAYYLILDRTTFRELVRLVRE